MIILFLPQILSVPRAALTGVRVSSVERHLSPLLQVCTHDIVLTISTLYVSISLPPSPPFPPSLPSLFPESLSPTLPPSLSTPQFEAQVVGDCEAAAANLNTQIDRGSLKATVKTSEGQGRVCYNVRLNI